MKPRIKVITLGVDDLDRSLRFYRDGLGLKTDGIIAKKCEGSGWIPKTGSWQWSKVLTSQIGARWSMILRLM